MLDYLIHPRTGLLVFPFLAAVLPAVWMGVVQKEEMVKIAKSSLSLWSTLLLATLLNLVIVVGVGAAELRADADDLTGDFANMGQASEIQCAGARGEPLDGPLDCLRQPLTALTASASDGAEWWVVGTALMFLIVAVAWVSTGSARRGHAMAELAALSRAATSQDRWKQRTLEFAIPSGLSVFVTYLVYIYGRGITG